MYLDLLVLSTLSLSLSYFQYGQCFQRQRPVIWWETQITPPDFCDMSKGAREKERMEVGREQAGSNFLPMLAWGGGEEAGGASYMR
jgi:hypothetical protein